MIELYELTGPALEVIRLNELILPNKLGSMPLAAGLLVAILFTILRNQKLPTIQRGFALLSASLCYVGVFMLYGDYRDEIFINLENVWNLKQHGLFSFSPVEMVSSTVEIIYYFLLYPFAYDRTILFQALYAMGGLVGWLHLLLLWHTTRSSPPALQLLLVVLFSLAIPMISLFANGFGNGLLSLVFLLALLRYLTGHVQQALWIAALLAIIRPDGILFVLAIHVVHIVSTRRIAIAPLVGALALLGAFFAVNYVMYGDAIPTPMLFKRFTLAMLPLINNDNQLGRALLHDISRPHYQFFLAALFFAAISRKDDFLRKLLLFALPLAAIYLFFQATSVMTSTTGTSRYHLPFAVFVVVMPILFLQWLQTIQTETSQWAIGIRKHVSSKPLVLCIASSALVLVTIGYTGYQERFRFRHLQRVSDLAVGAQILERVIPSQWQVATTELNAFGFMMDRPVVDLWGFTNREIAQSNICNNYLVRYDPEFFWRKPPDLYWYRTYRPSEQGGNYIISPKWAVNDLNKFYQEGAETFLARGENISKTHNQAGNMQRLLGAYDVVALKTYRYNTILFVKKENRDALSKRLRAMKFRRVGKRKLRLKKFLEEYNRQRLIEHPC